MKKLPLLGGESVRDFSFKLALAEARVFRKIDLNLRWIVILN